MASPVYTVINSSEVDSDSPLTAALAFRWAYNPISIMEGSPTARAAGMGVWIAKSPGGGDPAQTGILTDATDTSLRLAPDGSGSVAWSAVVNCSGNLNSSGTLSQSANTTAPSESDPSNGLVFGGKTIQQDVATSRMLVIFNGECSVSQSISDPQDWQTATITLYRKRSGTPTAIASRSVSAESSDWYLPISGPGFVAGFLVNFNHVMIDCQNGDSFYVIFQLTTSNYASKTWVGGMLTIASIN